MRILLASQADTFLTSIHAKKGMNKFFMKVVPIHMINLWKKQIQTDMLPDVIIYIYIYKRKLYYPQIFVIKSIIHIINNRYFKWIFVFFLWIQVFFFIGINEWDIDIIVSLYIYIYIMYF